jgi:hypothetical protein
MKARKEWAGRRLRLSSDTYPKWGDYKLRRYQIPPCSKGLSINKWRARRRRGKGVFCGGSVLLWYSTGAKNAFDDVCARQTLIYG